METIEQKELVHPVAVQMSLTRAFKARKDLNNMIQRMGQTLRRIRPFVHETELPAELTNLTTDSVENDIIEVEKLLHLTDRDQLKWISKEHYCLVLCPCRLG